MRAECKACNKAYRQKTFERTSKYLKEYREKPENKIRRSIWGKADHTNKKATDVRYRLTKNLRSRLWVAVRKGYKSGSAVKDLGCPIDQFKQYLEQQFTDGMTWENYGKFWHIDHILPLAYFDLEDDVQLKQACHYTNLCPLQARLNHVKKDKVDKETILVQNERYSKVTGKS